MAPSHFNRIFYRRDSRAPVETVFQLTIDFFTTWRLGRCLEDTQRKQFRKKDQLFNILKMAQSKNYPQNGKMADQKELLTQEV
jgi:hypothetical protein